MPIVQVSVWEGMSAENKKKTVEGITKIFVDLGMPPDAVNIVIYEAPKTNWLRVESCIRSCTQTSEAGPFQLIVLEFPWGNQD